MSKQCRCGPLLRSGRSVRGPHAQSGSFGVPKHALNSLRLRADLLAVAATRGKPPEGCLSQTPIAMSPFSFGNRVPRLLPRSGARITNPTALLVSNRTQVGIVAWRRLEIQHLCSRFIADAFRHGDPNHRATKRPCLRRDRRECRRARTRAPQPALDSWVRRNSETSRRSLCL